MVEGTPSRKSILVYKKFSGTACVSFKNAIIALAEYAKTNTGME